MAIINGNADNDTPTYVAALPYNDKQALDPPRLVVPPPILEYSSGKPGFHVTGSAAFEHGSESFGNPGFLRSVLAVYKLKMDHVMMSWTYENRRKAQPILPFLLLGPSSTARDATFIKNNGITFLLAVRSATAVKYRPKFLDPTTFPSSEGLQACTIDLDSPYDLITNLRPVIKAVNDHLELNCVNVPLTSVDDIRSKVLVYCESGNERSAVIVAAYLMVVFGVDTITALQIIQSQRFCINVDEGMKQMLLDLDTILNAERDVAHSRLNQSGVKDGSIQLHSKNINESRKRSWDQAYDSEEDLASEKFDVEPITHRSGIAPFTSV